MLAKRKYAGTCTFTVVLCGYELSDIGLLLPEICGMVAVMVSSCYSFNGRHHHFEFGDRHSAFCMVVMRSSISARFLKHRSENYKRGL